MPARLDRHDDWLIGDKLRDERESKMVTERRNRRRHFLLRGWHRLQIENRLQVRSSRLLKNFKSSVENPHKVSSGARISGAYWHPNWPGSVTLTIRGRDSFACDASIDLMIERPFAWIGTSVQSDIRLVDESHAPFENLVVWTSAGVALFEFRPQPAKGLDQRTPTLTQHWVSPRWWQSRVSHRCGRLELLIPFLKRSVPVPALNSLDIKATKTSVDRSFLDSGPRLAFVLCNSRMNPASSTSPGSQNENSSTSRADTFVINQHLTIVGSDPQCDWQLADSARTAPMAHFLSPWQALIIRDASALGIVSLNHLAPLSVNGEPRRAALLEVGDLVSFGGRTTFEVVVNPEAMSPEALVADHLTSGIDAGTARAISLTVSSQNLSPAESPAGSRDEHPVP